MASLPDYKALAEQMNTATPVSITQAAWRALFATAFAGIGDQLWKVPALLGDGTPADARRLLGLANVTIGYTDRGDWQPDTDYSTNDLVWCEGSSYGALVSHHSSNDFMADLKAGMWRAVGGDLAEQFATPTGASGIGFIQDGDGTVARTMLDKARERVAFRDFAGVIGDGAHDDTVGIVKALAFSASRGVPIEAEGWERFLVSRTIHVTMPGLVRMNGARFVTAANFSSEAIDYRGDICLPAVVIDANTFSVSDIGYRMDIALQGPYGGRGVNVPNIPMSQYINLDGVLMTGDAGQISEMDVRLWVEGFRDSAVIAGSHWYLENFQKPHVGKAWRRGWRLTRNADAGENIAWHGGVTADCINSEGSAVGIYEDGTTNIDSALFAHSIDYCDMSMDLRSGVWRLYGCHLENGNNRPHIRLSKTSQQSPTRLELYGSVPGSGPGGSGYSPPQDPAGRPYLIETNNLSSVYVSGGKIAVYNNVTTEVVRAASGVPLRVDFVGCWGDTKSNQMPGVPIPYQGNNALCNADFSWGNFGGWTVQGTPYTAWSVAPDSAGVNCAHVVCTDASSGGALQQSIAVEGGQTHFVNGFCEVLAMNGGYATLRIQQIASDGTVISDSTAVCGQIKGVTNGDAQLGAQIVIAMGAQVMNIKPYITGGVITANFKRIFSCKV